MVLLIQLIGVFVALVLMYITFVQYKRKEFSRAEGAFWLLAWVLFLFIALFPQSLDFIVVRLAVVRTLDFLMICGFLVMMSLAFYNYIEIRKCNRKLEKMVRKIALKQ